MDFSNDRLTITNQGNDIVEIDITGPIGGGFFEGEGASASELREELKAIDRLRVSKIVVNIDSLGGLVNHALSMHDLLAQSKSEIEVNITGMTASSATIIAMAGNTIRMSDNAMFLIHRASGLGYGNSDNLTAAAKDLQKVDERIVNIYAKRTGKSAEDVEGWMSADGGNGEWWSASEAKENGFIDEVYEPMRMVAQKISIEQIKNAGLPVPSNIKEMENEKTIKQKVMAWVREAIDNVTAKKDTTDDVKSLVEAEAERLEDTYKGEVQMMSAALNERDEQIEALKASVAEKDTEIEGLIKERDTIKAQLEEIQDGKSGKPAKKDPPVDTGNPKKVSEEEKMFKALEDVVGAQLKEKMNIADEFESN